MKKITPKAKTISLKVVIHLGALIPLVYLYYHAVIDDLGADPVKAVIHFTGVGAVNLLLLGLLVTPIAKHFKQGWLINVRRLLGLYAFTYCVFHLLNYLFFDLQFDFSLLISEILKRPYITVGMGAFVILLLLAITSVSYIKRKMGRRWQQLHNWIYPASILACIHFYWSQKSDVTEPIIYFVLLGGLFWFRKERIKRLLTRA